MNYLEEYAQRKFQDAVPAHKLGAPINWELLERMKTAPPRPRHDDNLGWPETYKESD